MKSFNLSPKILIPFLIFVLTFAGPLWAQESGIWEKFSTFDPASEGVIDHGAWSNFLESTVMQVGRSTRVLGYSRKEAYRISRITYGNNLPSRYEGNRVLLHLLDKSDKRFVRKYLKNIEALPERVPLAWLNRDQQLAFWLNLYNAAVVDRVIREYPISRLKKLRDEDDPTSFWFQKTLSVEGVSLSLRDIEEIVLHNWDNPLVIYGFWQGSVGGPTLPAEAYTGDNVWKILQYNAVEFVNSNRGVRIDGAEAEISQFYAWLNEAFDGSDAALLAHLQNLADPAFLVGIENVTRLKPKYYDWAVADLIGGSYHSGQPEKGTANAGARTPVGGGVLIDYAPRGIPPIPVSKRFPPQAVELITGILLNNDVPERTPLVTSEECAPGEECKIKKKSDSDG